MNTYTQVHPEVLRKMVRALDKAITFMNKNENQSQDIVIKRLEQDKAFITAIWDDFDWQLSLRQSILLTLEDEARWAIKNNLTDAKVMPNYLQFIYTDALEAVKPEAVTIFR